MAETQEDVFNDALRYVPVGEELDWATGEPAENIKQALTDRFAAAGKVPVPRGVGVHIEYAKMEKIDLVSVFYEAETHTMPNAVAQWALKHPDDFARAWLNGWVAEEAK